MAYKLRFEKKFTTFSKFQKVLNILFAFLFRKKQKLLTKCKQEFNPICDLKKRWVNAELCVYPWNSTFKNYILNYGKYKCYITSYKRKLNVIVTILMRCIN